MPSHAFLAIPNYARRARKAVLTRDKLIKALGPAARDAIEEKQNKHGFRWAARTALTDLHILDPTIRRNAIHLAEVIYNHESLRMEIESNKSVLVNKKPTKPNFQNAYAEAVFALKETSVVNESNLVRLLGNVYNANMFLEKLYQHQKHLSTAWEKQEEFIKAEQRAKGH